MTPLMVVGACLVCYVLGVVVGMAWGWWKCYTDFFGANDMNGGTDGE